jgi:hypothetical protein
MNWKNASKDGLPAHSREVLISIGGVYYVAVYKAEEKMFEEILYQKRFRAGEVETVYWTEISISEN